MATERVVAPAERMPRNVMARTLTIRDLPAALHARLVAAARRHRRSLNGEALRCLEAGLSGADAALEELRTEHRLAEIRALRDQLNGSGRWP